MPRKNQFNFSKKERIGVIVLAVLIIGLTVLLNVGHTTYLPDPFEVDQSKLSFLSFSETTAEVADDDDENKSPVYRLANFDPNKIGVEEWIEMGFSEKQAASIVNYRENYGPFKRKEDIRKLYVVSDQKYTEIEPYIVIVSAQPIEEKATASYETKVEKVKLDLNSADEEVLIGLSGIGPVYAKRIVKYRKKIGGFVSCDQLDELYISDEAKLALKENSIINPEHAKKTNINTATRAELEAIPYINWTAVALILKKREVETITSLDFLTHSAIDTTRKEKLHYYISF